MTSSYHKTYVHPPWYNVAAKYVATTVGWSIKNINAWSRGRLTKGFEEAILVLGPPFLQNT